MSLEETFPEDPWRPSLRYAASSLIPFNLPWSTEPIQIGTGFHSKLTHSTNPFTGESAFDQNSLQETRLRFHSEASGTFSHNESSFGSNSKDHMVFSLGASANVAIVNVSGQAKFEQNALSNSDGIRSTLSGNLFSGYVAYERTPELSTAARSILGCVRDSEDDSFEKKYGDYYVAALRVGAANATELSAGSSSDYSSEAKSYSVTVKVKILCWSVSTTKSGSSYESSATASGHIKYNGYDTLALSQSEGSGNDFSSHQQIIGKANCNLENGKLMQGRLGTAMAKMALSDGCWVSREKTQSLIKSGLVVELQMLPYAKLRGYISARTR